MRIFKGIEGSKNDGKLEKTKISGNKLYFIIYSHGTEFKHSGTDITDDVSAYMNKPYGAIRGTTRANDHRMYTQNIDSIEFLVDTNVDDHLLSNFMNEKAGACRNGGGPYEGAMIAAALSHARHEQKFDRMLKGIMLRYSPVLSKEGVCVYVRDWETKPGILVDKCSPNSKLREIVLNEEGVPVTKPITWAEKNYEENKRIKEEFIKQYPNLPDREEYVPKAFIKQVYEAPVEQQKPEQEPVLSPMPKAQVPQTPVKQVPSLTIQGADLIPAEDMPAPTDKL